MKKMVSDKGLRVQAPLPFPPAEASRKQPVEKWVLRWRGRGATVLAFCAYLAAAPARAEGANVAGYGALDCSQVLPSLDNAAERHGIVQWTLGFMSGANSAQMVHARAYRDLTNINVDLVAGSLRAACAETPTAPLVTAAEKLFGSRSVRALPKQR